MKWTNQSAFDRMVERLRDGTGQAIVDGTCMYRTPTGNCCVVGALIPDDQYSPQLKYVTVIDRNFGVPALEGLHKYMLWDMQHVHDDERSWDGTTFIGEARLEGIAEKYDLTYTPPAAEDVCIGEDR